jgi:fructan beta-fructosidase
MDMGSIIEIRPFGNESLIYTLSRTPHGYHLVTTRSIGEIGELKYLDTFGHKVVLDLPQEEFINLTAIIDRCSCELLLQAGEFCLTDLSFDREVNGIEIVCIKGRVAISELSFCSANNIPNTITKAA